MIKWEVKTRRVGTAGVKKRRGGSFEGVKNRNRKTKAARGHRKSKKTSKEEYTRGERRASQRKGKRL